MDETPAASPRVAVVICSRDRPELLAGALDALKRTIRPTDEVMIVDSASRTDATQAVAREAGFPTMRVEQPGVSRARNAGYKATSAELVAFSDDDCLPEENWISALEQAFATPRVGFLMGKVLPDRSLPIFLSVAVEEESLTFDASSSFPLLGVGANMAFRRTVLDDLGGFDELLGPGTRFPGGEDKDAFWRAARGGWIGRYEPSVVVQHRQWRSRNRVLRVFVSYGVGEGGWIAKRAQLEGSPVGRVLRARARDGLGRVWHNARTGYEHGIASELLQTYGALKGILQARSIPLVDGHYVEKT